MSDELICPDCIERLPRRAALTGKFGMAAPR
jgi:hypothetical protein